jgi:ketosteroid isomerase-like protein
MGTGIPFIEFSEMALMTKMFGTALLASVLATSLARGQSASADPRSQLQPLMDEEVLAANAHDTDRFLAAYLHDSTLVFVYNGTVVNGFTKLRELQYKAWNSPKTDAVYSVRGPDSYTVLAPDMVPATSLLASRRTAPAGEIKTNDMVITMVWKKRAEGWRIIQAHESTQAPQAPQK